MKILLFDTETIGLPADYNAPISNLENWPRMPQLAFIVAQKAENSDGFEILKKFSKLIKPDGWVVEDKAAELTGITTERAEKEGIPIHRAIKAFTKRLGSVDFLAAHNMSFDEKILGAEILRCGLEKGLPKLPKICTMKGSTKLCNIPGRYGPKWPKLIELHDKLFGVGFDGAHDAMVDVLALTRCFFQTPRNWRIYA